MAGFMSPDSHSNVISPKQRILELVSTDPMGCMTRPQGVCEYFRREHSFVYRCIFQGGKSPPSPWIPRIIAFYEAASKACELTPSENCGMLIADFPCNSDKLTSSRHRGTHFLTTSRHSSLPMFIGATPVFSALKAVPAS